MRFLIFAAVMAAGLSMFAEEVLPGAAPFAPSSDALEGLDFLGPYELSLAGAEECIGGEVHVDLDESRTRLRVRVYDNEYEARLGRLGTKMDYTIDAHNRIQDITTAEFMPKLPALQRANELSPMTSRPAPFPSGCSEITAVEDEDGKYGPFMIKTGAVGVVEVYKDGKKVGNALDVGYAIHANKKKGFEGSLSNGCIVIREADCRRLASILRADREDYANRRIERNFPLEIDKRPDGPRQTILVRERGNR